MKVRKNPLDLKYNIIIVDDHKMFLDGLLSIFNSEDQYVVLKSSTKAENILQYLKIYSDKVIDLVITDVNMPGIDGIELNRIIKEKYPKTKTLVVSMLNDGEVIDTLMQNGVNGYVSKNAEKKELLLAIETILSGEKYFSKEIKEVYLKNKFSNKQVQKINLTQREIDVITLIAKEHTTNEIAEILFLSKHTVESYRKNIIRKLNVRNLAGLTKFALKMKYIQN